MENKPHIKIDKFSDSLPFKYPGNNPIDTSKKQDINRAIHGNNLLEKANRIKEVFEIEKIENSILIQDNVVYVEFTSDWGYILSYDNFDKDGIRKNKNLFQLLNIKTEEREIEGIKEYRSSLVVVVNEGGISEFIKKIHSFLNENIFKIDKVTRDKIDTGNPQNNKLLTNIKDINLVINLSPFWVDGPEIPFPDENEDVWWEVWFRKTSVDKLDNVMFNLIANDCKIGEDELELTEHIVKLVKGTAKKLSQSLLLLDNLAELRKPQQIADFINHGSVTFETKKEYLDDLLQRTESNFNSNSVLICLLDSGVNNMHPLIKQFLPDDHLYTHNESWGKLDSEPYGGHGTGVAGLALYGDLTDALSHPHKIKIYHGLESYKVYHYNDPNNPELYGAITESATATPIIYRPNNLRIYCLTITDKNFRFNGRPSAWSSAIDKIIFGRNDIPQLFILSGGNVSINHHDDYPKLNYLETVHDPAQAYNAITVGTYTRKDKINISSGQSPLAINGDMAPSNSTSLLFQKNWPNKPDVVFEGGNSSTDGVYVSDNPDLKLLSLDSDFDTDIFIPFGDTSGAAALASKMVAEIRIQYPDFWVETIRALVIHSADWTRKMLNNKSIKDYKEHDKINLLRTVGYGVPILQKALYSANNSLTLIVEKNLQPYKKEKSAGKYNEYDFFELPWPKDVLASLEEKDVTLKVTLSYFIEPNPGSRRFATHYQYHSHQLDFEIINRYEKIEEFKARISKPEDEDDENKISRKGVSWTLGKSSSKGSIRKDFLTLSGIEMSERNIIAVYPKNGWYKNLKRQNKFNQKIRYSLIVSIETAEVDIDLYSPVLMKIMV